MRSSLDDRRKPMYFNHLANRRDKMELDDEMPDTKDASRPFLLRNKGEVGIYLDAIEAQSVNPKQFGLEHAFMMSLTDSLQDHLVGVNLVKIKGALEHRGLFKGVILEEIRKGMILIVTFDEVEALEALWKLFEKDKLSALFQELLITKDTLRECEVTRLTLRAKMWEDEYTACKEEISCRCQDRLSLNAFKNDIRLLKEIRAYQKTLGDYTLAMRNQEDYFERNIDDFMIDVKRILPEDAKTISSLGDFRKSVKVARGVRKGGFDIIDKYLKTLDDIKDYFEDVEVNVCYRLCQIHGVCETDEQRALKETILTSRKEMAEFLKPEHSLMRVRFPAWESKINAREKKMFYGLVSLVPMGLEKLIDLDHDIDDYITKFPDQL